MLPESVFALPEDCSRRLHQIIVRHRNHSVAKANGQLGASSGELHKLKNSCRSVKRREESEDHQCSLCLEPLRAGDKVTELPCGHVFHCGSPMEASSGRSRRKLNGRRKREQCKGVLYWLSNHHSCPHCRFTFPTELAAPSESEAVLVPLLHRQNRLISRQMEIIASQKRQLSEMASSSSPALPPATNQAQDMVSSTTTTERKKALVQLPRLSWQKSSCPVQRQARKAVLERVTNVALKDIVVRGAMDESTKSERLQELAAKIEFILYCCSPSFDAYSDCATLRQRTLDTVKNLAERARAMVHTSGSSPAAALAE